MSNVNFTLNTMVSKCQPQPQHYGAQTSARTSSLWCPNVNSTLNTMVPKRRHPHLNTMVLKRRPFSQHSGAQTSTATSTLYSWTLLNISKWSWLVRTIPFEMLPQYLCPMEHLYKFNIHQKYHLWFDQVRHAATLTKSFNLPNYRHVFIWFTE